MNKTIVSLKIATQTIFLLVGLLPLLSTAQPSICKGNSASGSLENGVMLPSGGGNYVTCSYLARTMDRTYVHSEVRDIVVNSYKSLEEHYPEKVYKYAETGLKKGGKFKPHIALFMREYLNTIRNDCSESYSATVM